MAGFLRFDPSEPEASLMTLVRFCDEIQPTPEQIPADFLQYFGIEVLANSLNLKFPELPSFDVADATAYMSGREFPSLDLLVEAIARRPSDIDKLFCCFHYVANNISYDFKSKSQKPEDVFATGIAVCAGYAGLMRHLALESGVKSYDILKHSNHAKGWTFNPLNPPTVVESNHDSVLVVIDGHPWLSEPTWGAGYSDTRREFHKEFNPKQFLRPLICTLNDHLPIGQNALWPAISLDRFLRCPKYRPREYDFRNESHPFQRFDAHGYVKVQFSISHAPDGSVAPHAKAINGNERTDVSRDLLAVQVLERGEKRTRWVLHAVFPAVGLYSLSVSIDKVQLTEMFVDNRQATSEVPFLRYSLGPDDYIPIQPTAGLTKIDSGFALIRFTAAAKWSKVSITTRGPDDEKQKELSQSVKLLVPSDESRCEFVIVTSFPRVGRWAVQVWLQNDSGASQSITTYRFDVERAIDEIVSPLECIPEDRQIAPVALPDELSITPNNASVISASLGFEVKASWVGDLRFSLRASGGSKSVHPKVLGTVEEGGRKTGTFQFAVSEPGLYYLCMFIGEHPCHKQFYALGIPRRPVQWVGPVQVIERRLAPMETTDAMSDDFLLIQPRQKLSKVDSGFALIRFAVVVQWSQLRITITDPDNQQHGDIFRHLKLITSDQSRCEHVIVISFPQIGRWAAKVWLENESGGCAFLTTHRFDVMSAIDRIVSPLECIPDDRCAVPLELPDTLCITPNFTAVVSKSLEFEVKMTYVGNVWFNLRPFRASKPVCPTEPETEEDRRPKTGKFQFSVSEPGIYQLCIWLQGQCYQQVYALGIAHLPVEWAKPEAMPQPGSERSDSTTVQTRP
jgi:hypothetical protein